MAVLKICAAISLSLWIGGLSLFVGVVVPAAFSAFQKEEAARFLGALFPSVDRWTLVWAAVTSGALFLVFLNRHLEPSSLVLELPVGVMFALTLYLGLILHPEIHDLKEKLDLPEFRGTAHQQTIQFAFERLHRRSVRLHGFLLFLGWLSLGLTPRFLK